MLIDFFFFFFATFSHGTPVCHCRVFGKHSSSMINTGLMVHLVHWTEQDTQPSTLCNNPATDSPPNTLLQFVRSIKTAVLHTALLLYNHHTTNCLDFNSFCPPLVSPPTHLESHLGLTASQPARFPLWFQDLAPDHGLLLRLTLNIKPAAVVNRAAGFQ